jgi:hypothetical protein
MCAECYIEDVGPAASRQQAPTLSMGKQFLQNNERLVEKLQSLREKVMGQKQKGLSTEPAFMVAPRKSIASGKDVCC